MLLLIGAPASGKTAFCVERMRAGLRQGKRDFRLLVPTTTLAEHLRNQLARENFVFSPRAVSTLGKYLADKVPDVRTAGAAALQIMCGEILQRTELAHYASVRDFPGFRSALVQAIQEFFGAGGTPELLEQADAEPDLLRIVSALTAELRTRNLYLRSERLRLIADRIAAGEPQGAICITGFFNFTLPEIEILRQLAQKSALTVTLPDSPGAAAAIAALRAFADEVRVMPQPPQACERVVVPSPTEDTESVEIARRILDEHRRGRLFRHMGVIVRSEQPAVPALRAAFERFGIPARFYFSTPLDSDPTIRYLNALVGAALSGWDYERTLTALRMHGSPVESWGDGFDHAVRERLPGRGLDTLMDLAPDGGKPHFDALDKLSSWRTDVASIELWSARFHQLPALLEFNPMFGSGSHERVLLLRAQATAIEHFRACVNEAAATLDAADPVPCSVFWAALKTVISAAPMHLVDRRRDVVHVVDVFEARQWQLPIVFLSGLLEGEFPKHFSEDPILPDGIRARLKLLGVPMRTTQDRQAEESFLFDLCLSRATERLYLTYAQLNRKGEPNLPSFFIERVQPATLEAASPVRPLPSRERAPEPHAIVYNEELRQVLAARHATLSATAIESYIQCPFNLFATRTLRLKEPPCNPWDRLNMLVQGNVGHATFERHFRDGVPIVQAFDEAFARLCEEAKVPPGYRTEAVRLELLYGVEALAASNPLPRWSQSFFEVPFEVDTGELKLRGRIDRLEVDEQGNAFVIDYKYQNRGRIRDTVAAHENGKKVQGGVYVLAARQLGHKPVGMVFCGFRQGVTVDGWMKPPFVPSLGIQSSDDAIAALPANAQQAAMEMLAGLRDGRIGPEPDDDSRCARCTFLKICRVDAAPAKRAADGAAQ